MLLLAQLADGHKAVWMLVKGEQDAEDGLTHGSVLVARADMSSPAFLFSVILPGLVLFCLLLQPLKAEGSTEKSQHVFSLCD